MNQTKAFESLRGSIWWLQQRLNHTQIKRINDDVTVVLKSYVDGGTHKEEMERFCLKAEAKPIGHSGPDGQIQLVLLGWEG